MLEKSQEILQAKIERHLTLRELKVMCFDLKIDYYGLEGKEELKDKANKLVRYCIRTYRYPDLLHKLSTEKPNVAWEEDLNDEELIEGEIVEQGVSEVAEVIDSATPIIFSRRKGKIIFAGEEMEKIQLEILGDFSDFGLDKQIDFIRFIAKVTDTDPEQFTILEVIAGRVKITVELPEKGADLLVQRLRKKDPILKLNFRIKNAIIGQSTKPFNSRTPTQQERERLFEKSLDAEKLELFILLYFNENGLRKLWLDLDTDIEYDKIPGVGKKEICESIVTACKNLNKYDSLVNLCLDKKPTAFLREILDAN